VCRDLRLRGDRTPILMLTAMDLTEDKVTGLRLGADDYLTKPFAFDELVARIEALMRRARAFEVNPKTVTVGDLTFDREALKVQRSGRAIELTAKELAILELLMTAPGKVLSRARILANVWGYDSDPLTNVVDVYIGRLRRKIDGDDAPPLIDTVRGFGYRLNVPPED
jgi:DNA-binding response OmpR family regulator